MPATRRRQLVTWSDTWWNVPIQISWTFGRQAQTAEVMQLALSFALSRFESRNVGAKLDSAMSTKLLLPCCAWKLILCARVYIKVGRNFRTGAPRPKRQTQRGCPAGVFAVLQIVCIFAARSNALWSVEPFSRTQTNKFGEDLCEFNTKGVLNKDLTNLIEKRQFEERFHPEIHTNRARTKM